MQSKWSVTQKNQRQAAPIARAAPQSGLHSQLQKVQSGVCSRNGRTAQQRMRKHQADTRLGRTNRSTIAEQVHNEGHGIFWKPAVVAQERNAKQRNQSFVHAQH